jgi:hypothetical protein
MSPLEECCPFCDKKGVIVKIMKEMRFLIKDRWFDIPYYVYKCVRCDQEFITTEPECDPFQKARDLGWVKG